MAGSVALHERRITKIQGNGKSTTEQFHSLNNKDKMHTGIVSHMLANYENTGVLVLKMQIC